MSSLAMSRFRSLVRRRVIRLQILIDAKLVLGQLFRRPPSAGWREDR